MSKSIAINSHEIVNTFNITSFQVSVQHFELFKGATLLVSLVDDTNTLRKQESLRLEGDDYKQWMNDDTFVYEFVANKCGFTIKPEPIPEPVQVVSTPTEQPVEQPVEQQTTTETTPSEQPVEQQTTTETTPSETTSTETTPSEQPVEQPAEQQTTTETTPTEQPAEQPQA